MFVSIIDIDIDMIIIYFFRDWAQIIAQGLGLSAGSDPQLKQNRALLWLIAVAFYVLKHQGKI